MKLVYPVIFHKSADPAEPVPYFVEIPDLDAMTQGTDIENAIEMAREIICIKVIELKNKGIAVPTPSAPETIDIDENAFVTLVDADIKAYEIRLQNRSVRKNCTIPMWLNDEAEKAGLNFSELLQQALKNALGI